MEKETRASPRKPRQRQTRRLCAAACLLLSKSNGAQSRGAPDPNRIRSRERGTAGPYGRGGEAATGPGGSGSAWHRAARLQLPARTAPTQPHPTGPGSPAGTGARLTPFTPRLTAGLCGRAASAIPAHPKRAPAPATAPPNTALGRWRRSRRSPPGSGTRRQRG